MGVYSPSPGTIYPRLARLEEEGLVTHDEVDGRKVYRITERAGRSCAAAGRARRARGGDDRVGQRHRPRVSGGRQADRAQPARGADLGGPGVRTGARDAARGLRGAPAGPGSGPDSASRARGGPTGGKRRPGPSPKTPGQARDAARAGRAGPRGRAGGRMSRTARPAQGRPGSPAGPGRGGSRLRLGRRLGRGGRAGGASGRRSCRDLERLAIQFARDLRRPRPGSRGASARHAVRPAGRSSRDAGPDQVRGLRRHGRPGHDPAGPGQAPNQDPARQQRDGS